MLYSEDIWKKYVEKVEDNFTLKKYPQFDPYFNFPKEKEKIHYLIKDPSGKKIAQHSFIPLVKILIKTPRYRYQDAEDGYGLETKIRPISFTSHFDNYIYGFYSFAINDLYQKYIIGRGFDECVLAYRNDLEGKCNIQFAKEAFDIIKGKKYCTAIALDIKGYFDSINHGILKEKWCKVIKKNELPLDQYKIFRSLTKYSYVNKSSILKHFEINLKKKRKNKEYWQTLLDLIPNQINRESFNGKFELLRKENLIVTNRPSKKVNDSEISGIPQGSSMSALLSNVYLIDFDEFLFNLGKKSGFSYRRYCDDILIICSPEDANDIKRLVVDEISKKYKLTIQDKKTEVIDFKDDKKGRVRAFKRNYSTETNSFLSVENDESNFKSLQYLGFEFNGQNIYIRPASLSRYFRKMKARIVKSVMMAYSKKSKSNIINKQQIYHRYSHLGRRNFIQYAINASKDSYTNSAGERKEGMDSKSIKRQISAHFGIILQEIQKTSKQRAYQVKSKSVKK